MKALARFIGTALAVLGTAYIVPGFIVDNFYAALIVALILSIFNFTLKPILLILTLPFNLITLGLFGFIVNAILILLIPPVMGLFSLTGFQVIGFVPALIGGILISVAGWILHTIFK